MSTTRRQKQRHPAHYPVHAPHGSQDAVPPLLSEDELPAPPPSRTNASLNLSVLHRLYPSIASIISIAPFAVLYDFSPTSATWEKAGIDGTLFVVSLEPTASEPERYATLLLNRRDLKNSFIPLTASSDVEVTTDYVILKSEDSVQAIWIFSEPPPASTAQTREINAAMIQECASSAERARLKISENIPPIQISDAPGAVEMGRQLSLRELFGTGLVASAAQPQQRNQQAASEQSHLFAPSADTDFFRTPVSHSRGPVDASREARGIDHLTAMLRNSGGR